MTALDTVSRWETFARLRAHLRFADNEWFVPVTLVFGLTMIVLAARSEIHRLKEQPAVVGPDGRALESRPREAFWKIPVGFACTAVLLALVWGVLWLRSYAPPSLTLPEAPRPPQFAFIKPSSGPVPENAAKVGPVTNLTIVPGGDVAVTIGQQGGITANRVEINGDQSLIRSLELAASIEYQTETLEVQSPSTDIGWRDDMAFFDDAKRRYRFIGPNFEFQNYQKVARTHLVAFKYTPEDSNGLLGGPVASLAHIRVAAFDWSRVFREIPNLPLATGECLVHLVMSLNGVQVLDESIRGDMRILQKGQVNIDVTNVFASVESKYKQGIRQRLAQ